jgi:hypothetical protein
MNLCTGCGEDFGSVSAFDAHRVGKYLQGGATEYTGPRGDWTPEQGRRCLTIDELGKRGWTQDSRGRWRRSSEGAPWARSENQVITERRPKRRGRGQDRLRSGGRSSPVPDSRKAASRG